MPLLLSDQDLACLEVAQKTLLSPLDYREVDLWRSAVVRSIKELLGVERTVLLLDPGEGSSYYSEDDVDTAFREYLDYYHMFDEGTRRQVLLQSYVANREMLCATDPDGLRKYHASAMYHDWHVPHGLTDAIAMHARLPSSTRPEAAIACYHSVEGHPSCSTRGVALLRFLHPAFVAGTETFLRYRHHRAQLLSLIDSMPEPLLLCDSAGGAIHVNRALQNALARIPDAELLRQAMLGLARAAAASLHTPTKAQGADVPGAPVHTFQSGGRQYRLRASYLGEALTGKEPLVLVALEGASAGLPCVAELKERYGLTTTQARVALLMADGKKDEEIARVLMNSVHTVRSHTDAVRRKLGARTRAEVGAMLRRA